MLAAVANRWDYLKAVSCLRQNTRVPVGEVLVAVCNILPNEITILLMLQNLQLKILVHPLQLV